jgi:hypothetical protein
MCIRQEEGFCGIQYTVQDNTTPDSFDLSDGVKNANVSFHKIIKLDLGFF